MIRLYEFSVSGNCHKVRLLLSFLEIPYQPVILDSKNKDHKAAQFLHLNPLGQVPVLEDGEVIVRDSQAILVYLASKYGGPDWWPHDPVALAHIHEWLSMAANEVARSLAAMRAKHRFGAEIYEADAQAKVQSVLSTLEKRLVSAKWLVGDKISIADLAMYPYVALAHEGQVDLNPYPSTRTWKLRIEAQPRYVSMPGIIVKST